MRPESGCSSYQISPPSSIGPHPSAATPVHKPVADAIRFDPASDLYSEAGTRSTSPRPDSGTSSSSGCRRSTIASRYRRRASENGSVVRSHRPWGMIVPSVSFIWIRMVTSRGSESSSSSSISMIHRPSRESSAIPISRVTPLEGVKTRVNARGDSMEGGWYLQLALMEGPPDRSSNFRRSAAAARCESDGSRSSSVSNASSSMKRATLPMSFRKNSWVIASIFERWNDAPRDPCPASKANDPPRTMIEQDRRCQCGSGNGDLHMTQEERKIAINDVMGDSVNTY